MDKKNLTTKETFDLAVQNQKKNNFQVAENLYKKVLKINPNHFGSVFLLGSLYAQSNNFDRAKQLLYKAIQINPNFADAHNNLANVLKELKEPKKAITCYEKAIQINPNFADAHYNLGNTFKLLDEYKKAKSCYEKAIQINPNFADAYNNLGTVFKKLAESRKAISCYEKAIKIKPNLADAHFNLGIVFSEFQEYQKAQACYEKAIKINPNFADAYNNLGTVFRVLREFEKAITCYEKAIYLKPDHGYAYSNILFSSLYFEKVDPKNYLSQAKKFRSSLKPINDNLLVKYQFKTKPKKLRIGFVSGDFREHPVGFFLLDTLNHLKNENLELIAYSNSLKKDSLSVKLKSHFTNWREIENQSNMDVINVIRKDGIHILIDLSGHSRKNRLPIFINKPAQIQVSWASYAASTGIPEIDYIIGDRFVTPKNESGHFTEKIFRLPNMWVCFSVPNFDVQISDPPVIKNGYVTFGSFNNLSKINDKVISLWSKILIAIPKSKIFLKTKELNNLYLKEKIISKFKENGINLNSIILEGGSPRSELLNSYNKVDISLDTFPYSGGVTSLEAIWMGVPVLTKKGFRFISHTTESINHNLGMSDWIANDENEYVKKAIKFSTDLELLTEINKNLRRAALKSPLFNSTLFAKQLNNAFWEMWNNFISK